MGWHVLVITPRKREAAMKFFEDNSCPSFKCRRIDDLRFFLEKIAEAMKAVSYIMEDDTMLQISGVPPEKVFVLNLSFLPDTFFSTKNCPFLDIGQQQIMGQVGTDQATWSLIRASFRTKRILAECFRQMTGGAMSLVAYHGPFTDKMKISDPTSHDNVNHFWKMLSMVIPGSVSQPPFAAGNATNVSKGMPHACTLLHTHVNLSMVRQEPHFDYQHTELVINDVDMCLPWGLDMSLGSGGFSINVWDGESFDWNFDLDRKGKAAENQHAMLLRIPFKYIFLMRGDTVHSGAMDNHLTNGALRLHMYLSPGSTPEKNSVAIRKQAGNAINTKAYGKNRIPPSLVSFLLDSYGKGW